MVTNILHSCLFRSCFVVSGAKDELVRVQVGEVIYSDSNTTFNPSTTSFSFPGRM